MHQHPTVTLMNLFKHVNIYLGGMDQDRPDEKSDQCVTGILKDFDEVNHEVHYELST